MALLNGNGVDGPALNGPAGAPQIETGGARSAHARAQYAAVAALRWHIFVNGLRSKLGAFEFGVRTVGFVMYAAFGLGAGAVMGVSAYFIVQESRWEFLPVLLWAVCFLWQLIPVMLASLQEQFDLSVLLRFPVSFWSYFVLYTVFGLADVSTILGALCCLGIWTGVTVARPDLSAWTALGLTVFAFFNILMARAIFAWIDRWLSQRKTREIVGAIFMILLLSLQLLNPAFHDRRHQRHATPQERYENYRRMTAEFLPWLETAQAVQRWLPPGLAARAIADSNAAQPVPALVSLSLLGLYAMAAGTVLAGRLRGEFRGENLGHAPKRTRAAPGLAKAPATRAIQDRRESQARPGSSGLIAAVIEKDLSNLLRTLPLLWALGVPVLMVLILATIFRNSASGAINPFPFALPLCVAYAQLGFTQFFYNNLGTEGAGIQLLFLSPVPIRTVLLAKNIFHAVLFGLDALLAATLATLRLGQSEGAMVAVTAAWLVFALPCNLAAGNIVSLTMPYRVNPGRISRQRGSQANAMISLLIELAVMGVGAAVVALAWYLDDPWIAVPVFVALAGAAFFVWLRVLANVDGMANRRRDTLIATLMKTS
jgi:ABC-2 type transport system permease protein